MSFNTVELIESNINIDERILDIKKQNEDVIYFISNKFNINPEEIIEEINNAYPNYLSILNNNYDPNKCKALIYKKKIKAQCHKLNKINGFCCTHNLEFNKSELKYGYIHIKKNETNTPQEINKTKTKKYGNIEVQRIIIDKLEYFIDPYTSYIYDFETRNFIGKLDDNQIIKNYEKL